MRLQKTVKRINITINLIVKSGITKTATTTDPRVPNRKNENRTVKLGISCAESPFFNFLKSLKVL